MDVVAKVQKREKMLRLQSTEEDNFGSKKKGKQIAAVSPLG